MKEWPKTDCEEARKGVPGPHRCHLFIVVLIVIDQTLQLILINVFANIAQA